MFTSSQLKAFAQIQESVMMDRCRIYEYTAGTPNVYGNTPAVYTHRGQLTICGFKRTNTAELLQGTDAVTIDAELRLPRTTVIKATDRVELVKRLGTWLDDPLMFSIVGIATPGPSGILVSIKLVG